MVKKGILVTSDIFSFSKMFSTVSKFYKKSMYVLFLYRVVNTIWKGGSYWTIFPFPECFQKTLATKTFGKGEFEDFWQYIHILKLWKHLYIWKCSRKRKTVCKHTINKLIIAFCFILWTNMMTIPHLPKESVG